MTLGCDYNGCPQSSEWAVYPNHRRQPELAVCLCDLHHALALESKSPKEEKYRAVTAFVRESLNG